MIARITTGNNLYGALSYNQEKVDQGHGRVLKSQHIKEPANGNFTVRETAQAIQRLIPAKFRTENPVIHISLNPDSRDNLTDDELSEIAEKYMQRMGWGEQPYIVFKHTDIDRHHIHIVSVQVAPDGKKIYDGKRNTRSVAITEQLEKEYRLHPAKDQKRTELWQLTPVDPGAGNLRRQISEVIKPLASMYRFQTMGEFRALLSFYNVGVEEVNGERDGVPYRGLIYAALNPEGHKVGSPIKSSVFGKGVGAEALERKFKRSGQQISDSRHIEALRHHIDEALLDADTEEKLRESLKSRGIDLFLRRHESGRITGATFIDHNTRTVMNGSRLGKPYSANALQERLGQSPISAASLQKQQPKLSIVKTKKNRVI